MKRDQVCISRYTDKDLTKPRKKILIGGLPVRADLLVPEGWTVSQGGDSDSPYFSFVWARCSELQSRFSSHLVRDRFMAIASAAHAKDFFQSFGPLRTSAKNVGEIGTAESVTLAYVQTYQQWFREAMLWSLGQEPADWSGERDLMTPGGANAFRRDLALSLRQPPAMTLEMALSKTASHSQQAVVPYFRVESKDVVSSIWASIYLDKARKLDGAVCAHCGDVFIRSGRHDKKYCDRTRCNGNRRVTAFRRQQKLKANGSKDGKA